MRLSVLGNCKLGLARGVALLVLSGLAAGCSSGAARFTDGLVTASTNPAPQQQQRQVARQVEPDLVREETYGINRAEPVRQVQRSSLPPVPGTTQSNARFERLEDREIVEEPVRRAAEPVRQAAEPVRQAVEPVRTAAASAPATVQQAAPRAAQASGIDPLSSAMERAGGSRAPAASTAERRDPPGWSSAGGSTITAREGETVYNLSRRYGVPADVLMKVNGLDKSGNLQVGQKVTIPVYAYSDRAPVSAPDSNPKVANAKSSRGVREPVDETATVASTPAPTRSQSAAQPAVRGGNQRATNGVYVVQSGDSLLGIARDNGTTMAAIRNANNMDNDNVRIGQKLTIPASGEASNAVRPATPARVAEVAPKAEPKRVAESKPRAEEPRKAAEAKPNVEPKKTAESKPKAETKKVAETKPKADSKKVAEVKPKAEEPKKVAESKAIDPTRTASTEPAKRKELAPAATAEAKPAPVATKRVAEIEKADESAAPSGTGIGKMRWPVRGRVVSNYGKGSGNSRDGIEIQVPEGTPVKAAENGVVIYAGNGLKDYGNTVLVRHDNGLVTVYGNASELNVKRGEKVRRGQDIARSGMTGSAQSPKLHFEVRKDSSPVDPSTYLE